MSLPETDHLGELRREILEIAKETLRPARVEDVRITDEEDILGDDLNLRVTIVIEDNSPALDPSSIFRFWRELDSRLEKINETRVPHFSYVKHSELDGEAA